jgi:WD40 repeat protein
VSVWDVHRSSSWPLENPEQVNVTAFSPDGSRLATVSFTGSVQVWDVSTGKEVIQLIGHRGSVNHVAFSTDGRRLLTSGDDHTARVWDVASGKAMVSAVKHDGFVVDPQFSPDGRHILTARRSGEEIWLWNITKRTQTPQFVHHGGSLVSVAFNASGSLFATAGGDATRIWNAATFTLERSIAHPPEVTNVAFSPDNRFIVTAGTDKTARIWHTATGKPAGDALRHDEAVEYVAFSPDSRRIATVSGDSSWEQGRLWETETGKPVASSPMGTADRKGTISYIAFRGDLRQMATVRSDEPHAAQVFDVATGEPVTVPMKLGEAMTLLTFSPDGKRLLTVVDLEARIWDLPSGRLATPPWTHGTFIDYGGFSADGRLAVTTSSDHNTVRLWDTRTGEAITPLLSSQSPRFAAFAPDAKRIVLVGEEAEKAEVWRLIQEDRPVPDLELLAQVLTASRLNGGGAQVPLEMDELQRAWKDLRARHP